MSSWSLNMHRSFSCGILQSSVATLHTLAGPAKTSFEWASVLREEYEVTEGFRRSVLEDLSKNWTSSILQPSAKRESFDGQRWKVLNQEEHGILDKWIPDYAWKVLRTLHERGHETYLVGGSVRDMLLQQVPKDFDVLTTAELKHVRKGFNQAFIVGRRFPVCQVHVRDKIVEVSSFSTVAKLSGVQNLMMSVKRSHSEMEGLRISDQRHFARWHNSKNRDFTINGLFYDPFRRMVYDYFEGIEDLKKKKVRTVQPAQKSFVEDSARILRALRIAARLGFKLSRETAIAIKLQSQSIKALNQERLRMEANYFMSYGAAEASFRLLWRFGLLEVLFPPQAAYLAAQGFKRQEKSSNMLLSLLGNLDRLLTPAKPCHCTLWINLLALHHALSENPQSAVVITALSLAVHGYQLETAVRKALRVHEKFGDIVEGFPEVDLEFKDVKKCAIKQKVQELGNNILTSLRLMNSPEYMSTVMWRYPESQSSDLVIVTKQLLVKCENLFLEIDRKMGTESISLKSEGKGKRVIDREALQQGMLDETGFVFSHIVLSTLYPGAAKKRKDKTEAAS